MTETEAVIWGAKAGLIGTIAGGIVGAIGTYIGAICLAYRNSRIIAGGKLREAFAPELAILTSPNDEDKKRMLSDILSDAFPKHHAAVVEFRYYLRGKQITAFNKAWADYYRYPNEERQYLIQYYFDTPSPAVDRINKIIEFTETRYIEKIRKIFKRDI